MAERRWSALIACTPTAVFGIWKEWRSTRRRTLRIDRIRAVREAEAPDIVVEPLPYDHPSHPTIRVRLTAAGARRVEREPHLGPHAREGLLEFRCPPSELDWYARYFGGMGADAHVEGPEELVERIVERARGVLGQYGRSVFWSFGGIGLFRTTK